MSQVPRSAAADRISATTAGQYAQKLLSDLGVTAEPFGEHLTIHPARRWAESGLLWLTGPTESEPALCPVPLPGCADGVLSAFHAISGRHILAGLGGAELLAERAALAGYGRQGSQSTTGHCRILPSRDGMMGINLARAEDWELLPALFESGRAMDWEAVATLLRARSTGELLTRARLLGLALVDAGTLPEGTSGWFRCQRHKAKAAPTGKTPLVVDLSSLWAGPLCSHLWQQAGARVIKVESRRRPDGAGRGSPEFFHLLNGGKEFLTLDLHAASGRRQLVELIEQADIVLEASRPRALRQMGIVAEELLDRLPGLTWVSITGYGRREPQGNWIAYGDDAGIAAGLSAILHQVSGDWCVCGDAVADPLAGLHAALAGWASWSAGGGRLIELALARVVRYCIQATAPPDHDFHSRYLAWRQYLLEHELSALPPRCDRGRA